MSQRRALEPQPGSPKPPAHLREAYADWEWAVVWQSTPDVITYRLHRLGRSLFLKLGQGYLYPSISDERERLQWAVDHIPVPEVTQSGSEGDVHWLLTTGLKGLDAAALRVSRKPEALVPILAQGLRDFHAIPPERCPFVFDNRAALTHVRGRLAADRIDPERDFHPEFSHLSAEAAVQRLEASSPPSEDLVVCHGDYCLPNVIIDGTEVSGFVDVGELGVADRWWDLAVATWSVTWNLGPGLEELFLHEYGVEKDEDRLWFYRLLYDLVS